MGGDRAPLQGLDTGTRLLLHHPRRDERWSVLVVQVKDGLVWISGRPRPGENGEQLLMEHAVPGDASYRAAARVVHVPPESWALRRVGDWERVQRREDVRIATAGLEVCVTPLSGGLGFAEPAETRRLAMIDLSAGGLAAGGRTALEPGERVRCAFELPAERAFEVAARVVRIRGRDQPGVEEVAAFQFTDIGEAERSALVRWIYREETRRHRRRKDLADGP